MPISNWFQTGIRLVLELETLTRRPHNKADRVQVVVTMTSAI